MKNVDVARDFAKGIENKTKNLFSEGRVIYSYGYHFPIALRLVDKVALFNQDGYSSSTSRHKGYVARALQSAGYKLEFVKTSFLQEAIRKDITNFKDLVIESL